MPRLWCWPELNRCLQLSLLSGAAPSAVQQGPIHADGPCECESLQPKIQL